MVFGRSCLADGSIALVCASRLSMVPALAASVHAVGLDGADHHLDSEPSPYVLCLASAHTWTSVVGSCLDHVAGIRIRRSGRCNQPMSPAHTIGNAPTHYGLGGAARHGA